MIGQIKEMSLKALSIKNDIIPELPMETKEQYQMEVQQIKNDIRCMIFRRR